MNKLVLLFLISLCLSIFGCAEYEETKDVESVFSTQIESYEKSKKVEGMIQDAAGNLREEIEKQEQ